MQGRFGEADAARLDSVSPHDVEQRTVRLVELGLPEHVEDVVGPDCFPVPRAHIHADQDVTLLDGRERRQAAR